MANLPWARPIALLLSISFLGAAEPTSAPDTASVERKWGDNWVWAEAEVGYDFVDLRTFDADLDELTLDLLPARSNGSMVGLALGGRLLFMTLGVRGQMTMLRHDVRSTEDDRWWLWRVGPELGVRIPLGRVEPHGALSLGYATIGGTRDLLRGLDEGLNRHLSIDGAYASATLGVNVFLVEELSVGLMAVGSVIALGRSGVPIRDLIEAKKVDTINETKARILEADGSSYGASLGVLTALRLHL